MAILLLRGLCPGLRFAFNIFRAGFTRDHISKTGIYMDPGIAAAGFPIILEIKFWAFVLFVSTPTAVANPFGGFCKRFK